jgi:hypothetical protein
MIVVYYYYTSLASLHQTVVKIVICSSCSASLCLLDDIEFEFRIPKIKSIHSENARCSWLSPIGQTGTCRTYTISQARSRGRFDRFELSCFHTTLRSHLAITFC